MRSEKKQRNFCCIKIRLLGNSREGRRFGGGPALTSGDEVARRAPLPRQPFTVANICGKNWMSNE
jgi:hypothetical protein